MPIATETGGAKNANSTTTHTTSRPPNFFALLLHIPTTIGLASAVLKDARVHWFPKMLFVGSLGTLVLALLFPEITASELVGLSIPGVGWALDAVGLPLDASVDWVALVVAAFNLLKLFPAEIVGEHYDRLFKR